MRSFSTTFWVPHADHTMQAPLIEIKRSPPNFNPDPTDPIGFGVIAKLDLSHGESVGEAYFDVEPVFPCFALFVDSSNALILQPREAAIRQSPRPRVPSGRDAQPQGADQDLEGAYVRIGIAKFLRTQSQREQESLLSLEAEFTRQPFGPIRPGDEKAVVTVV